MIKLLLTIVLNARGCCDLTTISYLLSQARIDRSHPRAGAWIETIETIKND